MEIKWLGHAAFLLTTGTGTKVITDPYVPGAYDGAVGYAPINEFADIVTVSHDHADHNGVRDLPGSPEVVRGKGNWTIKDVKISGVDTFHDPNQGRERGRNTIYLFETEGLRVAHLGDLGHIPDDATLKALGRVDILLVPVGGVFTIDARQAGELVRKINPRVVIPMHYKTPKLGFAIARVEDFFKVAPGVKRMGSSAVEVKVATLPKETETWVLDPAL